MQMLFTWIENLLQINAKFLIESVAGNTSVKLPKWNITPLQFNHITNTWILIFSITFGFLEEGEFRRGEDSSALLKCNLFRNLSFAEMEAENLPINYSTYLGTGQSRIMNSQGNQPQILFVNDILECPSHSLHITCNAMTQVISS